MQHFSADCLVLRAVDRGEHDKLLTLLSAEKGRFYAILKGAHSMHRREAAAAEPYTWSNLEFYERGGVKWVKTATALDSFPGIRYDMEKLFLAAYVADVAFELSDEHQPAGEILPLALNTLYMLSISKNECKRIKAAFELRAAAISGFCPDVEACHRCGAPLVTDCFFDVMNGAPLCHACGHRALGQPMPEFNEFGERTLILPLTASAMAAVAFVVSAQDKRVFSFLLKDAPSLESFAAVAEAYLLHHLERSFQTLENYKKMGTIAPPIKKTEELC